MHLNKKCPFKLTKPTKRKKKMRKQKHVKTKAWINVTDFVCSSS